MVVAAACFGETSFARDQPCASEGGVVVVDVVVAAAAAAALVVVRRRQFRAISSYEKVNCRIIWDRISSSSSFLRGGDTRAD